MKKDIICLILGQLIFINTNALPTTETEKTSFPPVNWVSHDSSDSITIQNGTDKPVTVQIVVNNNNDPDNPTPGINVKNCGTTTHIKSGSSTICSVHDAGSPISFTSESSTDAASGTYQIKEQ